MAELTVAETTGDRQALQRAVRAAQDAVDACPPQSPELPRYLVNLALARHAA